MKKTWKIVIVLLLCLTLCFYSAGCGMLLDLTPSGAGSGQSGTGGKTDGTSEEDNKQDETGGEQGETGNDQGETGGDNGGSGETGGGSGETGGETGTEPEEEDGEEHTEHLFNKKVTSFAYLAQAGTSVNKATYYYSCKCGAKGEATFLGGHSDYGYAALAGLTGGAAMQSLYKTLYDDCTAFAAAKGDATAKEDFFLAFEEEISSLHLTDTQIKNVWSLFCLENGEFYWLEGRYGTVKSGSSQKIRVYVDGDYATYAARQPYDGAIASMRASADDIVDDTMSDVEIAFALHNFIVHRIDYAYQADGVTPETANWAHNIVGCASKGKGVCECYAKTYRYLCLRYGVDCLTVSGKGNGEAHAWNVIMPDGAWYGVDCTWDEMSDSDKVAVANFGMSGGELAQKHTPNTPASESFMFTLPALSGKSIQMVEVYKEGDSLGLFGGTDAAFAAMTGDAAYEMVLGVDTYKGVSLYTGGNYYCYASSLPAGVDVTISGRYVEYANGTFSLPGFYLTTELAAETLTLRDLRLFGEKLTATALKVAGHYVYFNNDVTAETLSAACTLSVAAGTLSVGKLNNTAANRNVLFQGGTAGSFAEIEGDGSLLLLMYFTSETTLPRLTVGKSVNNVTFVLCGTVTVGEETVAAGKGNLSCTLATWTGDGYAKCCNVAALNGNTVSPYVKNTDYVRGEDGAISFQA